MAFDITVRRRLRIEADPDVHVIHCKRGWPRTDRVAKCLETRGALFWLACLRADDISYLVYRRVEWSDAVV